MSQTDNFFKQVETVREANQEIENNTRIIESLHSTILAEGGNTATAVKSQASLDAYQNNTTDLISELRLRMKQLQQAADSGNPQEISTKRALHSGLAKNLMQAARYYQNVQLKFKDEYKDRIRREYRVAKPNATDREIEEAAEAKTNVFSSQMATQNIGKSKKAFEDINSRHQEILKIEKSVTELYDLFLEMQTMLETQQEKINFIENNAVEVTEGIEMGNKEMEKAIKHRKSSRKMSWFICICVTILLIIAVVVIFNYIINPILLKSSSSGNSSSAPTPQTSSQLPLSTQPQITRPRPPN